MKKLSLVFLILMAHYCHAETKGLAWPKITPINVIFKLNEKNPHIKIDILSENGDPAYNFECHKGDLDKNYKSSGDFSGLFQCKLLPYYEDEIDLFVPGGDWNGRFTRATFNTVWRDSCESDKQYGLVRSFPLRNMKVEMELNPISYSPPMKTILKKRLDTPTNFSFEFKLKITSVKWASNARALPGAKVCLTNFFINKKGNVEERILRYYGN